MDKPLIEYERISRKFRTKILLMMAKFKRHEMNAEQYIESMEDTLLDIKQNREKVEEFITKDLGGVWSIWTECAECESLIQMCLRQKSF